MHEKLYLPDSQKVTQHFHDEVPAMKDVNSVYKALHVLLHASGLHNRSFSSSTYTTGKEKKNRHLSI